MSTERELIEKFKEAFETKKIDVIKPYMAEGMTYELLPSTVGSKMSKDQWAEEITRLFTLLNSIKLNPTNIVEHPLFVVVQTDVTLDFPGGGLTQEILLLFNFSKDESGSLKIASVVEYVDSFKVKEFKAKMASSAPPSQ